MMRGRLPPLEGDDHPSWLACVGRVKSDLSSCATPVIPEMGGGRHAKTPLAQVVVGPVGIHTHPRPR
jgi:hypothetical protein